MKVRQPLVLLVDDEEKALKLYEAMLAQEGVAIAKATDGQTALELFRRL
ncbi:hypothetical protein [Thermodesulfitimonas sp.]